MKIKFSLKCAKCSKFVAHKNITGDLLLCYRCESCGYEGFVEGTFAQVASPIVRSHPTATEGDEQVSNHEGTIKLFGWLVLGLATIVLYGAIFWLFQPNLSIWVIGPTIGLTTGLGVATLTSYLAYEINKSLLSQMRLVENESPPAPETPIVPGDPSV